MSNRRGVTLIEVLAAIFIMGIGLLAVLTLFPLGALSMARAVRDHDIATFGAYAAGNADAWDLRTDSNVGAQAQQVPGSNAAAYLAPDPDGPGYPVLIDPFYNQLGSNNVGQNLTSAPATPGIWRVSPSVATATTAGTFPLGTSNADVQNAFTFLDDLTFGPNGLPLNASVTASNATIDRPARLTVCYLMRRPKSSIPDLTEMSVLVYRGRDTSTLNAEPSYQATGTAGATTVTLNYATGDYAGTKPSIVAGNWIFDDTYDTRVDPSTGKTAYGWVHGYLYQVANVTDPNDNATLILELQTPLRANMSNATFMANVTYVLERGTYLRKR
jgi:prepilin-type N-terminal cleavage/methylation domain-containing protein